MTEYGMACLVCSLAGHDKGNYYIIVREDAHYVYLADGRTKTAAKPKRKKRKHVQLSLIHIFRSNNHMYAQIIDDTVGNTLVAASTAEKEVKAELEKTNDVAAAAHVGTVIAKRALEKGIKEVVFDRGGFIYHGKVQALADAAREAGLEF